MSAPLVFMDTETTGLSLTDDIWEFAAIRREPDGTETELHLFIDHNRQKCQALPESFAADHRARWPLSGSVSDSVASEAILRLFGDDRPHVIGAVPNFDTERVALLLRRNGIDRAPWHYHLIDVENLAVGFLAGVCRLGGAAADGSCSWLGGPPKPPWKSDDLAAALGVTISEDERHTAMGDARWAMRIYDAVMGGAS